MKWCFCVTFAWLPFSLFHTWMSTSGQSQYISRPLVEIVDTDEVTMYFSTYEVVCLELIKSYIKNVLVSVLQHCTSVSQLYPFNCLEIMVCVYGVCPRPNIANHSAPLCTPSPALKGWATRWSILAGHWGVCAEGFEVGGGNF